MTLVKANSIQLTTSVEFDFRGPPTFPILAHRLEFRCSQFGCCPSHLEAWSHPQRVQNRTEKQLQRRGEIEFRSYAFSKCVAPGQMKDGENGAFVMYCCYD